MPQPPAISKACPGTETHKEATLRMTPEQMRGLLAAGSSRVTRALRQWEPPAVEALQKLLAQYEIVAFIARGGMGAVYKAKQRALGRAVAVKILPPDIVDDDLDYAERFKREARAMASLSHPHIVAVHEAGETPEGLLYFVMEYIEGTDLAQLVRSAGRLDTERALDITRQVCEALAFAHAGGIVHRDIKPSNIMIDKSGHVKVADFGLAKIDLPEDAGQLTGGGVALGTPDYMAPETLSPLMPVDQRADLYAVGVMLYQMLTGDVPRGRFPLPSVVVPGIDARLDAIVDKAMQTDREQRYSSAVEMREALESIGVTACIETVAKHQRWLVALTVLAVAAGVAWWLRGPSQTDRSPAGATTTMQGPHWSRMPTEAEKKLAFTNTLGMTFVPVPGTEVLFCIHETRKKDYAVYAAEAAGVDPAWRSVVEYHGSRVSPSGDHPVVNVNLADAEGFCAWLSTKEGRRYRLPTDHEWSCAVGIGEREDALAWPVVHASFRPEFAWGTQWPPPRGAGNLGDESLKRITGQEPVITGYDDGFASTAPVMSFPPNPLGIHDLAGNVWERCSGWFDSRKAMGVRRGSSYDNGNPDPNGAYVAANVRNPTPPGHRSGNGGFRIVVEKP